MENILIHSIIPVFVLMSFAFFNFGSKNVIWISLILSGISVFLSFFYYAVNIFTGKGINEAVFFHIIYGFDGVGFSIIGFQVGLLVLFVLAVYYLLLYVKKIINSVKRKPRLMFELIVVCICSFFSIATHPAIIDAKYLFDGLWISQRSVEIDKDLGVGNFISNDSRNKKNLVYIYVESLERTFFDEKIFPDLIKNLREIEKKSVSFQGIRQAPMTDWTIAGMVASQCGVPLATFKLNRGGIYNDGNFVPGVTCIGDILQQAGYVNIYVGGADLSFAGKGGFYKEHGFNEIFGLQEIQKLNNNLLPTSKWGIYDDKLLDFSYEKYKSLLLQDHPFSLFILTADTHGPSGHRTPECKNIKYTDGSIEILNAVKCADFLVGNFISKIISVKTNRDVVFVIGSDHLQMNNEISFVLNENEAKRSNLFMILNKGIDPKIINRPSSTLDIAPTVMGVMGWKINKFALGRNLLSSDSTLVEKYGEKSFFKLLRSWRLNLWKNWISDK